MSLKSISIVFLLLLGLLGLAAVGNRPGGGKISAEIVQKNKVTVYKTFTCGCCTNYVSYLKRAGFEVEVQNLDDLSLIKSEKGIPDGVLSCHTSVVGNYVVEGHVPLEAIARLMNDNPDITGIGIPGMPQGSPGMPGAKTEPFVIWSFGKEGMTQFMTV